MNLGMVVGLPRHRRLYGDSHGMGDWDGDVDGGDGDPVPKSKQDSRQPRPGLLTKHRFERFLVHVDY